MKTCLLVCILCSFVAFVSPVVYAEDNLPTGYDSARDPQVDLNRAIEVSAKRKILLIIGGDWCNWCNILDNFLKENKNLNRELEENFVVVKVHYSEENKNEVFLSKFPRIMSLPHFIILRHDGVYMGEQQTGLLERGESYSKKSFEKFIDNWRWR